MWNKLNKQCVNVNNKIRYTQCRLTVLELTKMREKNLGTKDTEAFVDKSNKFVRDKLRRSIMKHKISNAMYDENVARRRFIAKYDYISRRWGHNRSIMSSFKTIMQEEVDQVWNEGREKTKEKIEHLMKKRRMRRLTPTTPPVWRGISISDEQLERRFAEPDYSAVVPDGFELN